jgi:ATP-dependent DNA ligase
MRILPNRPKTQSVPTNVNDWRPQRFGRGIRSVKSPIIEPSWGGVRVLARLELGRVRFFDEDGIDCTDEFENEAQALAAAALADEMILDGFLTVEPTQSSVGKNPAEPEAPGATQMMATMFVGQHGAPKPDRKRHLDTDQPIAFVAVDLLRIDQSLLVDLPLLERKRLLDGALVQDERIRVTPFVRPPVDSFGNTWRGMGFEEIAYKGENSRYYPAGQNDDWTIAPIPKR